MKKLICSSILFMGIFATTNINAQEQDAKQLKIQKEVLDLNSKLNDYKLQLAKELKSCENIKRNATHATEVADRKGRRFDNSENPDKNIRDAKVVEKKMRIAERENRKWNKCQSFVEKVQKNIMKTEHKISKLDKNINYVEQN